jgi:hypothetical protein
MYPTASLKVMMWAKTKINAPKKAAMVKCSLSVIIAKITAINVEAETIAGIASIFRSLPGKLQ